MDYIRKFFNSKNIEIMQSKVEDKLHKFVCGDAYFCVDNVELSYDNDYDDNKNNIRVDLITIRYYYGRTNEKYKVNKKDNIMFSIGELDACGLIAILYMKIRDNI